MPLGRSRGCALPGGPGLVVLTVAVTLSMACDARAQASPAELIAAMQAGGTVVFLRHAATHQHEIDTGRLGDRAGQRNLSAAGIRQAEALGRAFRALGIPLDPILASPVFRARDTAELAFGADRVEVSMDIVADDYAGGRAAAMVDATRRLLRTPPEPGTNRLLIGHRTPLQMATRRGFPDSVLPEGAMAVFEPGGDEGRLLGTLTADQLIAAAP